MDHFAQHRYWHTRTRTTPSGRPPTGTASWQVRDRWTDQPVSFHTRRIEAQRAAHNLNLREAARQSQQEHVA